MLYVEHMNHLQLLVNEVYESFTKAYLFRILLLHEHQFYYSRCLDARSSQQIQDRERRMTETLFLLCVSYMVFVLPLFITMCFNRNVSMPNLHLAVFCVYWIQYSANFVIYAARNQQYRRAYVLILTDIWAMITCKNSKQQTQL